MAGTLEFGSPPSHPPRKRREKGRPHLTCEFGALAEMLWICRGSAPPPSVHG